MAHLGRLAISALAILACAAGAAPTATADNAESKIDLRAPGHRYIMVDQFGYRPGDPKVAVLADPQVGFNASDRFTPSMTYEVRRA